MAHTAPPGYDSNHSAIMDLVRFGPAIWSCAQFQALLFHAERSTAYGKDADMHSEDQAMEGIYSVRQLCWIRGPLGVSRASWYRANADLELDPEEPSKTPNGVLKKTRTGKGRGQVIEYAIDWLAVKRRIAKWKEGSRIETLSGVARTKQGSQFETLSTGQKGSQSETLSGKEGSHSETFKGLSLRPFSENADVENKGGAGKEGSHSETHSQSLDFKSDLTSPSVCTSREALDLELELASGERPRTDGPSNQILDANQKYRLPFEVVRKFLHEKADEFRGRKKPVNPALLSKLFREDMIPWLKKNTDFVHECEVRRELERQKSSALREMQSPEAKEQQRLLDEAVAADHPQTGEQILADVMKQRKAKGASR